MYMNIINGGQSMVKTLPGLPNAFTFRHSIFFTNKQMHFLLVHNFLMSHRGSVRTASQTSYSESYAAKTTSIIQISNRPFSFWKKKEHHFITKIKGSKREFTLRPAQKRTEEHSKSILKTRHGNQKITDQ